MISSDTQIFLYFAIKLSKSFNTINNKKQKISYTLIRTNQHKNLKQKRILNNFPILTKNNLAP